ncbi:MAG: RHS repeat-associated core domain-containing protein, partial [Flavobacteriaceae bacterium]|nr:RHS repeat-associated core domain-containing protein [Flavobacteriaceae bacterium]
NFPNLPKEINQNNNITKYFYRADGTKIHKQYTFTNDTGSHIIETEYLDGFQYSTPNTEPLRIALEEPDEATQSAITAGEEEAFSSLDGRVIIPGGPGDPAEQALILSFFPTAEGYYDYENFRYIYQYKDHLGNVRISFVNNNNTPKVMDINDYYPFGMSFLKPEGVVSVYDPMAIPYNYKYNGKELQEFGAYDYGARFYMPDIGRWGVVDPLAEVSRRWNPYNYAYDNPLRFIDPDGRSPVKIGNPESADAKRLQNALLKTETGKQVWQAMVDSERTIYIHYVGRDGTKTEAQYLSESRASGETMTGKMYDEMKNTGSVSAESMDTMATFNENTGEYDKTSDWDETHIILSDRDVNIGNGVGEGIYGEKGNVIGELKTGGEEAVHSIQESFDFTQKIQDTTTGKYIPNENKVPYNERRHEVEAKQITKQMEDELINN